MTDTNKQWTRASSALADHLCPGRHLMCQKVPAKASGKDADFGSAVHKALCRNDPAGLTLEQHDIFESCQKIEARLVADYFGADAPNAIRTAYRERELWVEFPGGLRHHGTPDVVYRWGAKAFVPDYKSLCSDIPDADENLQTRDYICLAWLNTQMLDRIATAIIQPLVTHTPKPCEYSSSDVAKSLTEMELRVKASHDPNSKRVAGDKQCQWCPATSICHEYAAFGASKLPVPDNYVHAPVSMWSPEMRSIFCKNRPAAQKWLDDNYDEMKRLLKADPSSVPGFQLKDGAKPKPIIKPEVVYARFLEAGGTHEQYMQAVGITKGKLEGALAAVLKLKGEALSKRFEALLEGCVDNDKQNDASVAPIKKGKDKQ